MRVYLMLCLCDHVHVNVTDDLLILYLGILNQSSTTTRPDWSGAVSKPERKVLLLQMKADGTYNYFRPWYV